MTSKITTRNRTISGITPFQNNAINSVEGRIDALLAIIGFGMLITGGTLIARGVPFRALLLQDLSAIPWGEVWEGLEAIGLLGVLGRGSYWAWRKITGHDKYHDAIWRVLDDEKYPLEKGEIKHRVHDLLFPPVSSAQVVEVLTTSSTSLDRSLSRRRRRFSNKFEAAWKWMRQKGVIKKVDVRGYLLAGDEAGVDYEVR